jgi:hypothetical protein
MKTREAAPLCGWSLPFLFQTAVTLLGGALHLWTVLQLWRLGAGVGLSAAALVLPGIAEVAAGVVSYRAEGWGSPYCVTLLAYGWLVLANWLGFVLLSTFSDYEH